MELTHTERRILKFFCGKMDLVHLDQVKMIYGWRLFIADFKKIILMYGLALVIGCFVETLLIHTSFYFFRQVAFGAHSKNFFICLFVSCIVFPVSAVLLKELQIDIMHIWITFFFAIIPLLIFAPIGSAINAIRGAEHTKYLRKRIYIRLCIFGIVLLLIPVSTAKFLVTGLLIEAITIMISIIRRGG